MLNFSKKHWMEFPGYSLPFRSLMSSWSIQIDIQLDYEFKKCISFNSAILIKVYSIKLGKQKKFSHPTLEHKIFLKICENIWKIRFSFILRENRRKRLKRGRGRGKEGWGKEEVGKGGRERMRIKGRCSWLQCFH